LRQPPAEQRRANRREELRVVHVITFYGDLGGGAYERPLVAHRESTVIGDEQHQKRIVL
jgi:hypothetical protein